MAENTGNLPIALIEEAGPRPGALVVPDDIDNASNAEERQALVRLREWDTMAQTAYPRNSLRAFKADWTLFKHYCADNNESHVPASPQTVRRYIEACQRQGRAPATIKRYVATIARAHRAAELLSPCASEPVRLALKTLGQTTSARQRQARPLGWAEIGKFLKSAGKGIRADRERALLCVAYDLMARRSELVAINVEDLTFEADGSGTVLIRRSKTDQAGEGVRAYLARDTVPHLNRWLKVASIKEGAVFRRLHGRKALGDRLHADIISDIFKRVAKWTGLPKEEVSKVSGHSIRVGATQDLLALNIDLASVMQAGRWTSTAMPIRYGEKVLAARGGMARAAALQERD